MRHDEVRTRLQGYLDGEMSGRGKARMEAHLSSCSECSNALEELRLLVQSLRRLGDVDPPSGMTRAIMEKVLADAGGEKPAPRPIHAFFGSTGTRVAFGAVAALFLVFTSIFFFRIRAAGTAGAFLGGGKPGSVMGSPARASGGGQAEAQSDEMRSPSAGPAETAPDQERSAAGGLAAKEEAEPRASGVTAVEAPRGEAAPEPPAASVGGNIAPRPQAAPGIAPPRILLRVEDVQKAKAEIRKLVEAGSGKVQSEAAITGGAAIDVRLGQSELARFTDGLAAFGTVEEAPKPSESSGKGSILSVEVDVLKAGE